MAHLLIDADILVYRVGFSCESKLPDGTLLVDPEEIALDRMTKLYDEIFSACGGGMYTSYLTSTDKSNFRFKLFPEYKSSRKQPKPVHYNLLRNEVENHWNGVVVYGQEADDEIGIAHTADPDSIVITIDKDMDQLEGWHYNFVKKERYSVSKLGAIRNFYLQVLEGDTGDDVKGCPKIGKVKAMRYLEGCENEPEMLRVVLDLYERHHDDEWLDHLLLAGKLLWIRRYPNQPWTLTNGEVASKESLVKLSSNFESPMTTSQEQLTM